MSELGVVATASDYGGFDIPLSDTELYYLREAGIPPHLLNASDRAAVIRALMFDSRLIEDHKAGGFAALIYKSGALQDMLSLTADEISEAELADLDEDTKATLKGLPNKRYWLTNIHLLKINKQREITEEQIEESRLEEKKKQEERIRQEVVLFQQVGAARYAEMNPIPAVIVGALLAETLSPASRGVRLDDDGISMPNTQLLHPDQTPTRMMAQDMQRERSADRLQAITDNFSAIASSKALTFDRTTSAIAAPKSINFGDIPVTQLDVIQALTEVPKSITLVPEGLKDEDPTHLKAPIPERKVQHEVLAHGMQLAKDNKNN